MKIAEIRELATNELAEQYSDRRSELTLRCC